MPPATTRRGMFGERTDEMNAGLNAKLGRYAGEESARPEPSRPLVNSGGTSNPVQTNDSDTEEEREQINPNKIIEMIKAPEPENEEAFKAAISLCVHDGISLTLIKDGETDLLMLAVQHDKFNYFKLLIENKLPIEIESKTGRTPIHLLAEKGQLEVLSELVRLKVKMDLNCQDNYGVDQNGIFVSSNTPLHLAIISNKDNPSLQKKLIRVFLSYQQPINLALRNAPSHQSIVDLILNNPELSELLVELRTTGHDIFINDVYGADRLNKYLTQIQDDVTQLCIMDSYQQHLMSFAIQYCQSGNVKAMKKLLLEVDELSLNIADEYMPVFSLNDFVNAQVGRIPLLHIACCFEQIEIAKLLVFYGANLRAKVGYVDGFVIDGVFQPQQINAKEIKIASSVKDIMTDENYSIIAAVEQVKRDNEEGVALNRMQKGLTAGLRLKTTMLEDGPIVESSSTGLSERELNQHVLASFNPDSLRVTTNRVDISTITEKLILKVKADFQGLTEPEKKLCNEKVLVGIKATVLHVLKTKALPDSLDDLLEVMAACLKEAIISRQLDPRKLAPKLIQVIDQPHYKNDKVGVDSSAPILEKLFSTFIDFTLNKLDSNNPHKLPTQDALVTVLNISAIGKELIISPESLKHLNEMISPLLRQTNLCSFYARLASLNEGAPVFLGYMAKRVSDLLRTPDGNGGLRYFTLNKRKLTMSLNNRMRSDLSALLAQIFSEIDKDCGKFDLFEYPPESWQHFLRYKELAQKLEQTSETLMIKVSETQERIFLFRQYIQKISHDPAQFYLGDTINAIQSYTEDEATTEVRAGEVNHYKQILKTLVSNQMFKKYFEGSLGDYLEKRDPCFKNQFSSLRNLNDADSEIIYKMLFYYISEEINSSYYAACKMVLFDLHALYQTEIEGSLRFLTEASKSSLLDYYTKLEGSTVDKFNKIKLDTGILFTQLLQYFNNGQHVGETPEANAIHQHYTHTAEKSGRFGPDITKWISSTEPFSRQFQNVFSLMANVKLEMRYLDLRHANFVGLWFDWVQLTDCNVNAADFNQDTPNNHILDDVRTALISQGAYFHTRADRRLSMATQDTSSTAITRRPSSRHRRSSSTASNVSFSLLSTAGLIDRLGLWRRAQGEEEISLILVSQSDNQTHPASP